MLQMENRLLGWAQGTTRESRMFKASRWLGMLCALFLLAGCGGPPSAETVELEIALTKMPLPPDPREVRVVGKDRNDFFIQAQFPDKSQGAITDFYLAFFKENGWTVNAPEEVDVGSTLYYKKGKAETYVQVEESTPGTQVTISYIESEFALEEFDQVIRDTASPEARALIEQVKGVYGELTSYTDTGIAVFTSDSTITNRTTFKTAYRDPGELLFEYWDSQMETHFSAGVVGKRGDIVQSMADTDAEPTLEPDLAKALESIYGVTPCNVPALLLRSNPDGSFFYSHLRLLDEAKLDDGTVCLRLQGKDFRGRENTIWIGKEDLLIRMIELLGDKNYHQTTAYSPKVNVEIADEDLAFRKPVAKN